MTSQSSDGSRARSLRLEQLIALNDEIAALVRAGVPLDQGLAALGSDMPGRLGGVAREIAARVESGQAFLDAIGGPPTLDSRLAAAPRAAVAFPEAYRAVIAAGIRSGRLVDAVEAVASNARRLVHIRRYVGSILVYPILVIWILWAVLLFFFFTLAPTAATFAESFEPHGMFRTAIAWLVAHQRLTVGLVTLLPALWTIKALWWWTAAGRAGLLSPGWARWTVCWIPGMRRVLTGLAQATFTDLVALLTEHGTPLQTAIELAAAACGDRSLAGDAAKVVERLRQGASLAEATRNAERFPSLVTWVFSLQQGGEAASRGLRGAADVYRRAAERAIDGMQVCLPTAITVGLGCVVGAVYIGVIGWPWAAALRHLSAIMTQ